MHLAVQVEILQLGTASRIQPLHGDAEWMRKVLGLRSVFGFVSSPATEPHELFTIQIYAEWTPCAQGFVVRTWQMKYTNLVQSVPTLFDVFATIHFGRLFQAPQEPKKGQVPINSMPTDPKHPTSKKLQKRPHNVPSSDIQKSILGTRPLEWCRTVAFVTTSLAHPETITVGPDHGCLLVSHGLG